MTSTPTNNPHWDDGLGSLSRRRTAREALDWLETWVERGVDREFATMTYLLEVAVRGVYDHHGNESHLMEPKDCQTCRSLNLGVFAINTLDSHYAEITNSGGQSMGETT